MGDPCDMDEINRIAGKYGLVGKIVDETIRSTDDHLIVKL